MAEKRVKSGIALTPRHLALCDANLKLAGVRSRNDFVEQAIEFFAEYLAAQENPDLHAQAYNTPMMRRFESLSKSLGTGQYKLSVEMATIARLLSKVVSVSDAELRDIHADTMKQVKKMGSVPTFQRCAQMQREYERTQGDGE